MTVVKRIGKFSKVHGLGKFAEIVRTKRAESGKGLRETARLIGIGHSTLNRIESGKDMTMVSFARTCYYFGLKPEVFMRLVIQGNDLGSRR